MLPCMAERKNMEELAVTSFKGLANEWAVRSLTKIVNTEEDKAWERGL